MFDASSHASDDERWWCIPRKRTLLAFFLTLRADIYDHTSDTSMELDWERRWEKKARQKFGTKLFGMRQRRCVGARGLHDASDFTGRKKLRSEL